MKKVVFVIIGIILLSVSSNGQWYNRRYGVSDLNQLSLEQLSLALTNANFELGGSIFLIVAGAGGLFGGISLSKNAPAGDIGGALVGIFITALSIPVEVAGWIILTTNIGRKERIKEVMKNKELQLGFINLHNDNISSVSCISVLPCLSLTINF